MRIVHYCRHALVGQTGVANAARGWAGAVARLGEDVALAADAEQINLEGVPGVETIPVPHRRIGPLLVPRGLGETFGTADLVVLHGGWDPSTALASAIARRRGVPYIVLSHGVYHVAALERHWLRKRVWAGIVERRVLRRAHAVHVLFRTEEAGLERLGVSPALVVAPNGVEAPPGREWDGGSGGHLVFLGRYDPVHKGLDVLLRGLAAMPADERPALRMHGPDAHGGKAIVTQLVDELGISDRVTIGDPIYGDAKWELLTSAAGFVLTSRWEGAPMSLGEAASIGLPALVTGYAMGRLLADQRAAVCVDPTPESVAAGIRLLLSPEAARIGGRARACVRDQLSWDAVARSWLVQVRGLPTSSTNT